MRKNAMPILVVSALATLPGCGSPTTEFDEAIGETSEALTPAPVGYWNFDDCLQGIVPNEQGDWGDATLHNGASCGLPGWLGTAGIFDGVDDRAEIPYHSALDFPTAVTVSAWVKPDDTTPAQTIVGKWYTPNSYRLWLSNGNYRFSVALAEGGTVTVATPATASVFAEVVGIFNGSKLEIRINGYPMASVNAVGTIQPSTRPVTIGNHPTWAPFKGAIDEVKLYDFAFPTKPPGRPGQCYGAGCSGSQCCDPYTEPFGN